MPVPDIRFARARASILVAMILPGCGGEAGTGPPPPRSPPVPPTVTLRPEANNLRDLPAGTTVRVTVDVRDGNGWRAVGVRVAFQVEEGGGSVDPASAVTGTGGRAETLWTLGRSGAQALSATAGGVTARVSATLCPPIILDPRPELGRPLVVDHLEAACGVSVEAPEAGAYYRFTLVGTRAAPYRVDSVTLAVESGGTAAHAPPVRGARSTAPPSARAADADPHPGRIERDRQVLSWVARADGPRFLPDLRGTVPRAQSDPPEEREFTWGRPGTVEYNCTVGRTTTGVLVAHNDDIAIYVDNTLALDVFAEPARMGADLYRRFGAPVIERYFGGVGDVDGDGRILVLVEDLQLGVDAFVWMGELLSREDCPASNQAELVRVKHTAFEPRVGFRILRTLAHEAKHVSSHHQLVRRAAAGGKGHFEVQHPLWVEEGTAEISAEVAARLGWESIGGPAPGATVRASDLGTGGPSSPLWQPEAWGVQQVLERYGQVIVSQPNSVTKGEPYGAGWGFFRFLGDRFGGAGDSRLGDADLFARLNDAGTPVGLDGVREVTGRDFHELMLDYAQAVSLAGTSSPEVPGVPRFTTYDFTGLNVGFSHLLHDGRFPYPVTTTGTGPETPVWLPLAELTTIEGEIGSDGFRVHDFRAEAAGDRAVFRVSAPEHVRLVVTRIPDQKER